MKTIREKYEQLMDLYADLKHEIRVEMPYEYERWKAGGFLIDEDILSMYPHIGQVIDKIDPEDVEDDEIADLELDRGPLDDDSGLN